MSFTDFNSDNSVGMKGEELFERNFLNFYNIKFQNVSSSSFYQKKDIDYITAGGNKYEVKNNYKDDDQLIIEEFHNVDEKYDKIIKGWWYQTEADFVVFVSSTTYQMIFLKMNKGARAKYEEIKGNYKLIKNKVSYNPRNPNPKTNKWVSAFRKINLAEFSGYYSLIK